MGVGGFSGLRCRVLGLSGFRVLGLRVWIRGFRVQGFKVHGSIIRVCDSGFEVSGHEVTAFQGVRACRRLRACRLDDFELRS